MYMMSICLLIIAIGVLVFALFVNAQTRAYLWELDNMMHIWHESTGHEEEIPAHECTD